MNFETIARPYAQAIYDHSEGWEADLEQLELALEAPEVQMLIDSPKLAYKEKTEVFLSLFEGQIESKTNNFVRVLGESKRISLIPHISKEYRKLLSGAQIRCWTDHKNLTFKTFSIQRILRWRLFIDQFDCTINYIEGKKNVLADCFSRLP